MNDAVIKIGTVVDGLGTVVDIIGTPGTAECKYEIDFDNDLLANQYKDDNLVPQVVIDCYNM